MTASYENVRNYAGWLDLSDWGLVRATGPDRARFLQGQTTNDLGILQPGQGIYTAFCTSTGHLLSDAYILHEGESLLLLLPAATFQVILERLQTLIILDELELTSLEEVLGVISLQGSQAAAVLEELGIQNPPAGELEHRTTAWYGSPLHLVRCDRTGSGGYDLFIPYEHLEAFKTALLINGANQIAPTTWHVLRYEAGIPLYGVDMDSTILASEMGPAFEAKSISYTKGCYTGQEVLMRIHARGHTNRTWVPMKVEGETPPLPGDTVKAENRPDAGHITGAVFSPAINGILAWGFVRNQYIIPDTPLRIQHGETSLAALVIEKPDPGRRETPDA